MTRVALADARKRLTMPELVAGKSYFVSTEEGGVIVLTPQDVGSIGARLVRADSRKRITLSEIIPAGPYLVTAEADGVVHVSMAVVLPLAMTRSV